MKITVCLFYYKVLRFSKNRQKPIKDNWLYLLIVTQETLIFMGYYASGFCSLISHLLHGGAIHAWLLKTLTGISCMLIFFRCVANHYKCRSLRQTSVYYLTVSGMASLVSLLGSHRVESRSWPVAFSLGLGILFKACSGCWQNWVPYSCRLRFPFSYWLLTESLS